jgi:iron complex outermembrane receptor protein
LTITSFDFGGISGTFDADGFYNDFRNQQLLLSFQALCNTDLNVACVTPTSSTLNLGKSQIDGLELDATVVPYDGVALQIGYTYLDTGVISARKPPAVVGLFSVQPSAQAGDGLPLSPKNKLSLTASYRLPLDDSIGRITLSTTFTYTDTMLTNYIDLQVPGYAYLSRTPATKLLDFDLNWEQVMGHPVDLSVFATNVTGDQYYTYTGGLLGAADIETASIGAPTLYGVRVKIHFGED